MRLRPKALILIRAWAPWGTGFGKDESMKRAEMGPLPFLISVEVVLGQPFHRQHSDINKFHVARRQVAP